VCVCVRTYIPSVLVRVCASVCAHTSRPLTTHLASLLRCFVVACRHFTLGEILVVIPLIVVMCIIAASSTTDVGGSGSAASIPLAITLVRSDDGCLIGRL
jgi:uncharacterized membrane protein YoaK (UPF0700 family)